jgi:hypothetical protein
MVKSAETLFNPTEKGLDIAFTEKPVIDSNLTAPTIFSLEHFHKDGDPSRLCRRQNLH